MTNAVFIFLGLERFFSLKTQSLNYLIKVEVTFIGVLGIDTAGRRDRLVQGWKRKVQEPVIVVVAEEMNMPNQSWL